MHLNINALVASDDLQWKSSDSKFKRYSNFLFIIPPDKIIADVWTVLLGFFFSSVFRGD